MKAKTISVLCVLQLTAALHLSAAPRTVAVVNFTNHTGGIGLQYLSRALPESISATLAQFKDIRVVERGHLGRLIDEIALEQTGIFDERMVSRAGRLLRADVLILGSFTGSPEDIVLSLKAVDVATGNVIDGRVVRAPLAKIFDSANQAALSISVLIAGKNLGYLSVGTTPDGADIYIDGMQVRQSPLVEYKLPEGYHRLRAVKSGYLEADTTIAILSGKHERWNPYLVDAGVRNRTEIGAGLMYFGPIENKLQAAPLYLAFFGQNFDRIQIAGEFGYSRIPHSQTLNTPFGDIEHKREYNFFSFTGHLSLLIFDLSEYVVPYVGAFAGLTKLVDFHEEAGDWEKVRDQNLFALGGKSGINIVPFSSVSIFIEGRFYYHPKKIIRDEYESNGLLGDLSVNEKHIYFNAFTIGGGIRYYFE